MLPDGWYGRPFDSLFALSLVRGFPDGLQIELEGGRKLSFQGSIIVKSSHYEKYPSIEISGFESALWVPNSGVSKEHVYRNDGSVVFASMSVAKAPLGYTQKYLPDSHAKIHLWANQKWIEYQMLEGKRIIDIGAPRPELNPRGQGALPPCDYYDLERSIADGGYITGVGPAPAIGATMFVRGKKYVRQVRVPERRGLLVWGDYVYEVMTSPGVVETVSAKRLDKALGLDPKGAQNDQQECQRIADRLYKEGKHEDWVEYSTGFVIPSSELAEY